MKVLIVFMFLSVSNIILSQNPNLEVLVSRDTLLSGNTFMLTIKATNINADIFEPELDGLRYAPGVSQSSSMQMINGDIIQAKEYRFTIVAEKEGHFTIPSIAVAENDIVFESTSINIVVLPNPEGKIEEDINGNGSSNFFFEWNQTIPGVEDQMPANKNKKDKKRIKRI